MALVFAVYVEGLDFYYSWGNFSDIVYIGFNLMEVSIVLFKLLIVFCYRTSFINLIKYTQKHIWNGEYEEEGYQLYREANFQCMISLGIFCFLTQCTVGCYILKPIIESAGRNKSDRVLPFNFRIDFPFSESPYYEMTFVIQVLSLYHVGICYFCFDNFLYIINIHLAYQFKILQRKLPKVCDWNHDTKESELAREDEEYALKITTRIYDGLKDCIRSHQRLIKYSEEVEKIFNFLSMGQVLVISFVICMVGFQIFLAEGPPTRRVIFIVHIMATTFQLFTFTSTCHGVMETSNDIVRAAFFSGWYNLPMNKAGRMLRRDILMIIMRAKRPCVLTAGRFFPVTLATFTKVISTAMSYFTLMRQSLAKMEEIQ
ncbi:odorant receptor 10-like [Prorops nasuta]|uniref:odorant receptor 10-like n=1 Tax=Prorops nasuta TaxID=863751 RepID=UPI0034CD5468